MFKNRSNFLFLTVSLELVLSFWALFYFNYLNRLNYYEATNHQTTELALLIENMFTNSWWALIILTVTLATIFSLVCLIYKDLKFQFIAICLWIVLFVLALDINDAIMNNISALFIFLPVFALNTYSYFEQKKLNSLV